MSAWGDTNGYQSGSNTAILALNQGDRVYLVLQEGKPPLLDIMCSITFEDFLVKDSFLKLLDMLFSLGNLHETNNGGRGYTTFSGFRIR